MSDQLQKFMFDAAPVRDEYISLDATWRAVLERHDYPPAVRHLLGEMMAAAALLRKHPRPTDAQIDEAMTNLCRCATYHRIREAIHDAAKR